MKEVNVSDSNDDFMDGKSIDEILDSVRDSILSDDLDDDLDDDSDNDSNDDSNDVSENVSDNVIELTNMIKPPPNRDKKVASKTANKTGNNALDKKALDSAIRQRVEELLPSLVQAWLDEHLPSVIEGSAKAEFVRLLRDLQHSVIEKP